jgi:hypothetical protein
MERIEGAAHGWPQAPYETKAEVDANYKRMVEFGCQPAHAEAVHLGIASHNLFDIAYGLTLREAHGVTAWVEFEMLEGMANHQARAVQSRAGGLLLYAPVVRAEDFHSAIAYLVRRLDENTAPENFLRHVFDLEPGSPEWVTERDRFLAAFDLQGDLSDAPRRTQDRSAEERGPAAAPVSSRFRTRPIPTGRSARTAPGSRASWTGGAGRRRTPSPSRSAAPSTPAPGTRTATIPHARAASRTAMRSRAPGTWIARSTPPAPPSPRGAGWPRRTAGLSSRRARTSSSGAAAISPAR